ncbi:MAG TPA: 50S ribosomal protein L11 methyltransferase [Thermoanaerobaculia bacterium]|nr:50S ribosomal protein L11 methyltransferase [Thermoanaerobaculia bacterium]
MPSDFLLDISFDARDTALEELIQSRLFLTASTGSTSAEINGTNTISAYFDTPEERDAAAEELRDAGDVELHGTERERVDWLDRYQQSLEPLFIGRRFVVVPDAALLPPDADLTIIVPQEQAFGTGSHETTSLCIELLESLPLAGTRGLDVGAGSGILALAMHRLGAAKAIAFDNDPDAYGALRDNRIRNDVPDAAMPLFIGSVEALRGGAFDVVTMNIIPEVILPLLGDVVVRLAPDARLILSGILIVKRDDVVATAQTHGLHLVEERKKGEWWAGMFARV